MKRIILLSGALVLAFMSAVRGESKPPRVHAITLPVMTPELPDGPGKDAVMGRCVLCHSPRYILMQPAFSEQTWIAEVTKMKKTFGAPIADEQVEEIVKYLVSIRGK
jgi:hypothetical protein